MIGRKSDWKPNGTRHASREQLRSLEERTLLPTPSDRASKGVSTEASRRIALRSSVTATDPAHDGLSPPEYKTRVFVS